MLHSWIELLMWKMSLLYFDRRSRNQNPVPPAFTIASPSLELGEAMVKVGWSIPLVEPELSPVPSFFTGTSAAIAVLFAPWPAEVCQVDSSSLASRNFDS
jgi:hypothetical protein